MKTYRWFLMAVLALSLGFQSLTVNAGALLQVVRSASISLSAPIPNPSVIGGDTTLNLVINVANINPGVSSAEIYLGYDPALLTPPATPNGAAAVSYTHPRAH